MAKRIRDKIYLCGVVLTFLSYAGIAESFTGRGSTAVALIFFVIGLVMVLVGYTK